MSESKREVIQAGRKLLLEIGGSDAECWAQNDKTYERATELADMVAQLVGYPQRDEDGECFYPEEPSTPEPAAVDRAAAWQEPAQLLLRCADYLQEYPNSHGVACGARARDVANAMLRSASPERRPAAPKEDS